MNFQDFKILYPINQGGFGTVYLTERLKDKKLFAFKHINIYKFMKQIGEYNYNRTINIINQEVYYLIQLSNYPTCHPNIVCYYGTIKNNDDVYIVMEYIEGDTLDRTFYKKFHNNINSSYNYILNIIRQLLETLNYIHERGIVHADIKSSNILIQDDKPIIIDFGISCTINTKSCNKFGGTPGYIAPEVEKEKKLFQASDIWSLGITIAKLYRNNIIHDDKGNIIGLNTNSILLNNLVNSMLTIDYTKRPTAKELLSYLSQQLLSKQPSLLNVPISLSIPSVYSNQQTTLMPTILNIPPINNNQQMSLMSTVLNTPPIYSNQQMTLMPTVLNTPIILTPTVLNTPTILTPTVLNTPSI